jgi:hypothetical protein
MSKGRIVYRGFVLTPLAAFDEGSYAALLIVEKPDESERASGVLGHFADAEEARRFAVEYGVAAIDCGQLPQPSIGASSGTN